MYPLNAIVIGCDERSLPHVRRELTNCAVQIEAEFLEPGAAVDALRRSQSEKRLLIVDLGPSHDLRVLSRLTASFAGWPVVALVAADDQTNGTHHDRIIEIMRAGASQIVSLPLRADDFKAALDRIAVQFVYSARETKVIAVAGVTGGCGATTIAINLSYEIAYQHGLRCILADLSLRLGAVASHLDLEPKYTINDLLRDISRVDTVLVQRALAKVADNLEVLAGPHQLAAPVTTSTRDVAWIVDTLKQLSDVVVLDVPCTYDDLYFETLSRAGQVVLIGEQKISSIRALKMVRDALRRDGGTEHLVINRFDPKEKGFAVERLLKPLGVPSLLTVARDDRAMSVAVNEACCLRLAAPRSPALADIVALAKTLVAVEAPAQVRPIRLLSRLARAFSNT